jgi:hypothetical protein
MQIPPHHKRVQQRQDVWEALEEARRRQIEYDQLRADIVEDIRSAYERGGSDKSEEGSETGCVASGGVLGIL